MVLILMKKAVFFPMYILLNDFLELVRDPLLEKL